jgi:hypothetical protein
MPKFAPESVKFVLTISTDPDIFDKYPNFRFNWDTPQQFIMQTAKGIEQISEDSYGENTFGYCVEVGPMGEDDCRDLSIKLLDRLIQCGYVAPNTHENDGHEFNVQDEINNVINTHGGIVEEE